MSHDELYTHCTGKFNPNHISRSVNVTWGHIKNIKRLTHCNPFYRDAKGVFLRNAVLTGCITERHGKYIRQEIMYSDNMYKDIIVECIDNHMFRHAKLWNNRDLYGVFNIKRFPIQAQNIVYNLLIVNKRLLNTKKNTNFFKYGFFPRDIMNIIVSHVLHNYIEEFIISDSSISDSLNTITIPSIKKISKVKDNTRFKNKRKYEIIENVVSEFSEQSKKNRIMKKICNSCPHVLGYVKCKENDVEICCDILNPTLKPFIMVGRTWQNNGSGLRFDNVDLDCVNLVDAKKISRNHIKLRYDPLMKKIQVYFFGRNTTLLNNKFLEHKQWTTLNEGDELVQPNTNIVYSFYLN